MQFYSANNSPDRSPKHAKPQTPSNRLRARADGFAFSSNQKIRLVGDTQDLLESETLPGEVLALRIYSTITLVQLPTNITTEGNFMITNFKVSFHNRCTIMLLDNFQSV